MTSSSSANRRRGRPGADRLSLVEQVIALRLQEPDLSANEIQRRVGARRSDVLRAVKILRGVAQSDRSSSSPERWFPFRESGASIRPKEA
jgi:hypothetical protein